MKTAAKIALQSIRRTSMSRLLYEHTGMLYEIDCGGKISGKIISYNATCECISHPRIQSSKHRYGLRET